MSKNICPHCGAWGQLSKFCSRCGKTLIYASVKEGTQEFVNKPVAKSTAGKDIPIILISSAVLTILVLTLLFKFLNSLD